MDLQIQLKVAAVDLEGCRRNFGRVGIGGGGFEKTFAQRLDHFLIRNLGLRAHRREERQGKKPRNEKRGDRHAFGSRGTE